MVNSTKLFNDFQMAKEMKAIGEKEYNLQARKIDSLYNLINNTSDSEHSNFLLQRIVAEKDSLTTFQRKFISEQTLNVWARIKIYTNDYIKDKPYKIVIGAADSNDNLIYGAPEKDITNDLLQFINKKYEGAD